MIWSKVIQVAVLIVSLVASTVIYKRWPNIKQDNAVEELVEDYILEITDLDIDLSLGSAEV